jgi:hypothetical protein
VAGVRPPDGDSQADLTLPAPVPPRSVLTRPYVWLIGGLVLALTAAAWTVVALNTSNSQPTGNAPTSAAGPDASQLPSSSAAGTPAASASPSSGLTASPKPPGSPGGSRPVGPPVGGPWPNASNTGVPAGTQLSTYAGPCTINAAGTVIDAKTINCG